MGITRKNSFFGILLFLIVFSFCLCVVAKTSVKDKKIIVISHGVIALKKRIELIESAKERIDLETFFIYPGRGTDLILDALAKKASQGIKVNILVDHFVMVANQNDHKLANFARRKNINLRFFNTNKLNRNRRDHRKILCIDEGKNGCLLGGRNISDEYWGMGNKFHHLDHEILIENSDVNKEIFKSFLSFWSYKYSENSSHFLRDDKRNFITSTNKDLEKLYSEVMNFDEKIISKEFQNIYADCQDVEFITDLPHMNTQTSPRLKEYISDVKQNLIIESPTFILRFTKQRVPIHDLLQKNIPVSALFLGEDADNLAIAIFNKDDAKSFARCGLKAYAKNKDFFSHEEYKFINKKYEKVPFLMHSKVYLRDDKDIWIGSYNLDPRSDNINAELGIICHDNPELAAELKYSMESWQKAAHLLDLYGNNYSKDGREKTVKKYLMKQSLRPFKRLL